MSGVGDRIRISRRLRRVSQAVLAERVGVGQRSVANWESGRRDVRLPTLKRVAAELYVTVDFLLHGDAGEDAAAEVGRLFRSLSPADRMMVVGLLRRLARTE